MRIKEIASRDRPRERLQRKGVEALSDSELLAILLQKGTHGENVVQMSQRILSKHPLEELASMSTRELESIRGIGFASACKLRASFELASRKKKEKSGLKMNSAEEVYKYLEPRISGLNREHFFVLHLDSRNRIRKLEQVSAGTLDTTPVHPREVFRSAVRENASAVVAVHNHPSGDPTPSEEDFSVTADLFESSIILGIPMLDHVIVADGYFSFSEQTDLFDHLYQES